MAPLESRRFRLGRKLEKRCCSSGIRCHITQLDRVPTPILQELVQLVKALDKGSFWDEASWWPCCHETTCKCPCRS